MGMHGGLLQMDHMAAAIQATHLQAALAQHLHSPELADMSHIKYRLHMHSLHMHPACALGLCSGH